jgi:hypothetical protein
MKPQKNNVIDLDKEKAVQDRYVKIVDKLLGLEERLDRVESLLVEIHQQVVPQASFSFRK